MKLAPILFLLLLAACAHRVDDVDALGAETASGPSPPTLVERLQNTDWNDLDNYPRF